MTSESSVNRLHLFIYGWEASGFCMQLDDASNECWAAHHPLHEACTEERRAGGDSVS